METRHDSDHTTRTTCPYCGVGCGVEVRQHVDTVTVAGDPAHPANRGRLCVKGSALHETLDTRTRLLNPQVGGAVCSWESALDTTARRLREIIDQHGPDAVAFYVSGQLLTEDYYVANKLMKGFIGSGNIDTNSRLCMSSAVSGYKRAFGSDTVPCDYRDLELADLVILAGSNAAWAHPVLYQRLVAAKRARPQMRVVCIDPRRTASADIADLHLPLNPGSDAMLFTGLLHYLCQNNAIDEDFVYTHTKGLIKTLSVSSRLAGSLDAVAARTGLHRDQLQTFYNWFTRTEKTVTLFSQGLNQSAGGTDNANAVINCHLATGRIGKPGCGPFSLTGQPNAMGGREVGGLATQLAAHMDFGDPEAHKRVSWFWNTNTLARQPGLKAVELFDAVADGRVRALWVMGTNPAVSMPQSERITAALQRCEFLVVSDCEANTDTTRHAEVLLPALAWGEKSGTVTNSERVISRQRAFLAAAGQARPDWWILSQVARRLGYASAFDYHSSAQIFREHAALSAFENNGRRDFDIGALAELSDEAYECLPPMQWPLSRRPSERRLFADGRFYTDDGRANFVPVGEDKTPLPSPHHPYLLNSGRLRDQWHTMTRTAKSPRLLQHAEQPFVEIHPADARREGLRDGQLVTLRAHHGGEYVAPVTFSEAQQPGSLFVPIHWNERFSHRAKASALSSARTDPHSGQPAFKHATVALQPLRGAWRARLVTRAQAPLPDCRYACRVPHGELQRFELAGDEPLPLREPWLKAASGARGDWFVHRDPALGLFRAACVARGQLQALVYYSSAGPLPEAAGLWSLFALDPQQRSNRRAFLAGRAPAAETDASAVVCACHASTENAIRAAIAKRGCRSVQALGEALGCGTGCGSCLPELNALLQQTEACEA